MIFLKELKMCLSELTIVDDTLETLEVPKEYQRLHNWIIRIIIGWIVYGFYQIIYFNFVFFFVLNKDLNFLNFFFSTSISILNYYPSNVIILNSLISAAILRLVLYMCIIHVYLLYKLFLLCVKMFIV